MTRQRPLHLSITMVCVALLGYAMGALACQSLASSFYPPAPRADAFPRTPGVVRYLDPQRYLDSARYAPYYYGTMAEVFRDLQRGDTILLYGKLREEGLETPAYVTDVTIMGMGTKVRPGHTGTPSGVQGGAADWSHPNDGSAVPLLTVRSVGWAFHHLHFGGHPNASTLVLSRQGDSTEFHANHTEVVDCLFSGGLRGIEDQGGSGHILVRDSLFYRLTTAIQSTNTSVALPLLWEIANNRFVSNTAHIVMPLSYSVVRGNVFFRSGFERPTMMQLDLRGGLNNVVVQNVDEHGVVDALR